MTDLSAIDGPALIAAIRGGKPEAIDQAYRLTFAGDLGRLVLAHHLAECGVGNQLGREALEYVAGKHDGALLLASKAGYDQASISVAVLTDDLKGDEDDGSDNRTEQQFDDWERGDD